MALGRAAEHAAGVSGADVHRLVRSAARFCRGGPGRAQRPVHAQQLCADPGFDRYRERWTECTPLLVREQHLLTAVFEGLKAALPFALVGIDTDNDTVFINETVKA